MDVSDVMSVRTTDFWIQSNVNVYVSYRYHWFLCMGTPHVVTGMSPVLGVVFAILPLIAVPSAIKTFNWITTLWKGTIGSRFLCSSV